MSIPSQVSRGLYRPAGYLQEVTGTTHATPGSPVTVTIPQDHNGNVMTGFVVLLVSRGAAAVWEDFAARTTTTITVKSPTASVPFVAVFS